MTRHLVRSVLCLTVFLFGGWVPHASAAEATPSAPAVEPETPTVRIYLCTEHHYRPWMKRMMAPADYNPWHTTTWVELYLPDHKLACRLGAASFFPATDDRYVPRLRPRAMSRAYVPRAHPRTGHLSAVPLTQLTLTDEARAELVAKLREHARGKSGRR